MYVDDLRFGIYYDKHRPGLAVFMRDTIAYSVIYEKVEQWKKILTSDQYHILREAGTETAGGCVFSINREGVFHCIACDNPLRMKRTEVICARCYGHLAQM